MTVFLTPQGQPFYAGTYFPPTRRGQMPGFADVLVAVSDTWRQRTDEVREQAAQVVDRISQMRQQQPAGSALPTSVDVGNAVAVLSKEYDYARGGFGGAPKFPPSMVLEFLLRHHVRTGSSDALLLAEGTLRSMSGGGIYDQLAGGFARYSVDADWVVPHFEKMLYDNALLARVALHLWQVTDRALGRRVAEETADFLLGELCTAEGGFASALDADSEGVEGQYYVWTPAQLVDVLGDDDAAWAGQLLSVTEAGTFEHGQSVLQLRSEPDDPQRWQRVRAELLAARGRRVRPARDDKVVAGWNGLAVAALAEIGVATNRSELIDAAVRCAELLWTEHWTGDRLMRVSRDGVVGDAMGVLEDYAGVAEGWLALYQTTGDVRWYERALAVVEVALSSFAGDDGSFFDTSVDAERLVRRPQEWTDNASPCGQSLFAGALLTTAALSGEPSLRSAVESLLPGAHPYMTGAPRFAGWWLAVAEAWLDGPREIAVVGSAGERRDALVDAAWSWPAPGRVIAVANEADDRVGLLKGRTSEEPRAWVCRDFRCELPTGDPAVLLTQLRGEA
jgi:uncharacterized protein YyaL (SSP411 family)